MLVKSVLVISLMLSIITIPRVEMLMVQGGPQEIAENQLKRAYEDLYELIADKGCGLEGGILTFKSPMGLPYYRVLVIYWLIRLSRENSTHL